MKESDVILILRYPSARFVEYALSFANLTQREETAMNLCGRRGMTQERAAEKADISVDTMQRWYRAGIEKLVAAWENDAVIAAVIAETKRKNAMSKN